MSTPYFRKPVSIYEEDGFDESDSDLAAYFFVDCLQIEERFLIDLQNVHLPPVLHRNYGNLVYLKAIPMIAEGHHPDRLTNDPSSLVTLKKEFLHLLSSLGFINTRLQSDNEELIAIGCVAVIKFKWMGGTCCDNMVYNIG